MADLFTVISDQTVMDQTQIAIYREGVILAAYENTNFMPDSPLISQRKDGDGATVNFFKFAQLTGGATLTDGVEVTSEAIVDSKAYVTMIEHGNVVTFTDMGDVSTGGRLNAAVPQLVGQNMGTYFDKYFIQLLETSSNDYVSNVGGEGAVTASDVLTSTMWEKGYTYLRAGNIAPLMDGLYCAFVHPHILADIRQASSTGDWTPVNQYSNPTSILRNEVGTYKGFKIIQSSNVTVNADAGASAVDTYHTSLFGYNALGLGMSTSRPLQLTAIDGTDKLNRFLHLGWKGIFGGCLVDTGASCLLTAASAYGTN